jgi:hypothetical protein
MTSLNPFYPRDRSLFKGAISKGQQAQASAPKTAQEFFASAQKPKPINPLAPVNPATTKYVSSKNALGGESYSLLS